MVKPAYARGQIWLDTQTRLPVLILSEPLPNSDSMYVRFCAPRQIDTANGIYVSEFTLGSARDSDLVPITEHELLEQILTDDKLVMTSGFLAQLKEMGKW